MFSVLSYRREGTVAKVTAGSSVLKCSRACVYLSNHVTAAGVKNRQQTLEQTGKKQTYIFIGGLVEGDQVGMEASQSHHRPEGEKTHQNLQHSATGGQGHNMLKNIYNMLKKEMCLNFEISLFSNTKVFFLNIYIYMCYVPVQLLHKQYVNTTFSLISFTAWQVYQELILFFKSSASGS